MSDEASKAKNVADREGKHATEALLKAKAEIRAICGSYNDRVKRVRRLFLEERAKALGSLREVEYDIKARVSEFYDIPYRSVCFAGSAQIGFSIHKDRLFLPKQSDLDVACVDVSLFQRAWADIITTTRAFTDATVFSGINQDDVELFKDSILRRGMIRVELMPRSALSNKWQQFEQGQTRFYKQEFGKVTIAIYMSEYAFCWKQDSVIASFVGT